jgi:hypothetical protein
MDTPENRAQYIIICSGRTMQSVQIVNSVGVALLSKAHAPTGAMKDWLERASAVMETYQDAMAPLIDELEGMD